MLDPIEQEIGLENEYGIIFGDIFYLRYYDINLFFYVCRTSLHQVCVYELAKKKIKYQGKTVEVLCPKLNPTRSPLIIKDNNTYTKSRFWVDIKDKDNIWIPIKSDMPIVEKIYKEEGIVPEFGDYPAVKLEAEKKHGVLNFYWE